jgi:medium-chain acyl-[acyl-carrier-protein] hydrolase
VLWRPRCTPEATGHNPPPLPSELPRNPWLVRRKPVAFPRVRLFCFPYAGAGSLVFFRWPDQLGPEVDVCSLQLPGREGRLTEPPVSDLSTLVTKLVEVVSPYLDADFAFFGHSFGAVLAFELTRELRRRALPLPGVLFVSGRPAPSYRTSEIPLSSLRGDAFVRGLAERYGSIPQAILDEPEVRELVMRTLLADLTIAEGYAPAYRAEAPLPVRICAFGGVTDARGNEAQLEGWRSETRSTFKLQMFPGGHFFINEVTDQVLSAIRRELAQGGGP